MNGSGSFDVAAAKRSERRLRARSAPVVEPARRGLFRRRRNRRITVSSASMVVWVAQALQTGLRRGLVVLKSLAAVAMLAGAAWGMAQAVRHVVASPRFAVREVRIAATDHVPRDEVLALAGVAEGDKLLSIDTDLVAARVAGHPWVASARVRRELPSVLAIDVVERHAAAVAVLGGMYLIDAAGRPFKRATLQEAEGLILVTGLSRTQYAAFRDASEAAFREALQVLGQYRDATGAARPALSEIHIDPRYGFSLLLDEGGGEIRLGRGDYPDKLERLDRIIGGLRTLGAHDPARIRTVHLDGPHRDRVPVRLAETAPAR
jgi:cell division protein FtsQ